MLELKIYVHVAIIFLIFCSCFVNYVTTFTVISAIPSASTTSFNFGRAIPINNKNLRGKSNKSNNSLFSPINVKKSSIQLSPSINSGMNSVERINMRSPSSPSSSSLISNGLIEATTVGMITSPSLTFKPCINSIHTTTATATAIDNIGSEYSRLNSDNDYQNNNNSDNNSDKNTDATFLTTGIFAMTSFGAAAVYASSSSSSSKNKKPIAAKKIANGQYNHRLLQPSSSQFNEEEGSLMIDSAVSQNESNKFTTIRDLDNKENNETEEEEMKTGGPIDIFDVAVVGAGPSGVALAGVLVNKFNLKVLLLEDNFEKEWATNYGVWMDELDSCSHALDFDFSNSLQMKWDYVENFFGGIDGIPNEERYRYQRAYGRLDRIKLKQNLLNWFTSNGGITKESRVIPKSFKHTASYSTFECKDGTFNTAKFILDCTGFNTKITERENNTIIPGVQVAYGIDCDVENYPYEGDAMTLMDYRTDYSDSNSDLHDTIESKPTFMYAMPLDTPEKIKDSKITRAFFEETSLIARPGLDIEICKKRLNARLKHLGSTVVKIHETELCFIPMGGSLPRQDQRVIAFGAAAGLVHPATGYQLCRTLGAVSSVAEKIVDELKISHDDDKKLFNSEKSSRTIYNTLWTIENRLENDFFQFGGEFLSELQSSELRQFFNAFFKLPPKLWSGFLAGWPGLTDDDDIYESWNGRLSMGLQFVYFLPNHLRLLMIKSAIRNNYIFTLGRSVTFLATLYGAGKRLEDAFLLLLLANKHNK